MLSPAGAAVVFFGLPLAGPVPALRGLLLRLAARAVLAPAPLKQWRPCPRCASMPTKGHFRAAFGSPLSPAITLCYPFVTNHLVMQRSGFLGNCSRKSWAAVPA